MRSLALALVAGCAVEEQLVAPIDQGVTSWQLLASSTGERTAVVLEPRVVHRFEHGVITLGYETRIVGPTIAVDTATNEALATFAQGATEVVTGSTRAWVLQQELDHWSHAPPRGGTPRGPLVHATVLDRSTLAVVESAALSPPIDVPVAIGDDLLDVPTSGFSDIERDVVIRRRLPDVELHAGRGSGSSACARGAALVVAYQTAAGIRLVAVRPSGVGEALVPAARLDAEVAIQCDATASRVALAVVAAGSRRVQIVDVASGAVTLDVPNASGPLAIRGDGTAVVAPVIASVAESLDGGALLYADAAGTHPVGFSLPRSPQPPRIAGELALYQVDRGLRLVHLDGGTLGPELAGPDTTYDAVVWDQRFVVQEKRFVYDDLSYRLTRLALVDGAELTDLPLPDVDRDPALFRPSGARLVLRADSAEGAHGLYVYDLATRTLVGRTALPLCDRPTMLRGAGCR